MDAFTAAEVDEIESYLLSQDVDSPPESPIDHPHGLSKSMVGGQPHMGGSGFDPDAWHFDIHGNLISAPQAAYENMEVQQLSMPPMTMNSASVPHPPFYPPPHMVHRPGTHPVPVGRGIPPTMGGYICQQQPDVSDMFQAQLNIGSPGHNMNNAHPGPVPSCHFFAQGRCRNGSNCQFSHDPPSSPTSGHSNGESRKTCRYFAQGRCRNGSNCRFLHEEAPPTASTPC